MNVQCSDVGLYWPVYLLRVNSSIQYSLLVRQTLQSRLMMLDSLLLLAWMYFWHISFVSTWRLVDIHQSQSQKMVLWHPASQVHFDPLENTEGSLCICTPNWQCAANAQELLDTWKLIFISMLKTSQKADRGTLCRSLLPVGNPSALQALRLELVDLPPRTSCSCDAISCRLDQLQKVDWDQAESKLI